LPRPQRRPQIIDSCYAFASDGDMMEGVSSEAASLAGHLELGNLCWIYDSNRVTIEGHTSLAFSEDVAARFLAYGWNVQRVSDANDTERLAQAIDKFRRTHDVPTLIVIDSHIGYGAPHKHDSSAAHGEPLAITRERHRFAVECHYVERERLPLEAGGDVPDANRVVGRSAGEPLAIGAEGHTQDRVFMPLQRLGNLLGVQVPKQNNVVRAAGRRLEHEPLHPEEDEDHEASGAADEE